MKEYKAINVLYEDGFDYANELNSYFKTGWEFVASLEIGNARGGRDVIVILASDA